jgi:hypothetical protein
VQAYQTSQCMVARGDIFLAKWRSSFIGSSDGKMNVQSACALNTRYILILFSHLRLGLPSRIFPSGFPNKTLYTFLFASMRATYPAHLILVINILIAFGEQYKL